MFILRIFLYLLGPLSHYPLALVKVPKFGPETFQDIEYHRDTRQIQVGVRPWMAILWALWAIKVGKLSLVPTGEWMAECQIFNLLPYWLTNWAILIIRSTLPPRIPPIPTSTPFKIIHALQASINKLTPRIDRIICLDYICTLGIRIRTSYYHSAMVEIIMLN